jgi:hypothetical protein
VVRPHDDYEQFLAATRACRHTLHGVTNVVAELPGQGLGWWTGDIGRRYWRANLDALARGVRIDRVFVYTTMTAELAELIATQERAGVRVGRVRAGAVDPTLRLNLAVWDGAAAWEARLNAGGEIAGNVFTVNKADLARLAGVFQACERAAASAASSS